MTDYWLSKLFFDIQSPDTLARWKADRDAVLAEYPLSAEMREAVLNDDLEAIAPYVNAYLLRFYFSISGMKDDEMLARLHAMKPQAAAGQTAEGNTQNG
jgi:gallate dioxygenase